MIVMEEMMKKLVSNALMEEMMKKLVSHAFFFAYCHSVSLSKQLYYGGSL